MGMREYERDMRPRPLRPEPNGNLSRKKLRPCQCFRWIVFSRRPFRELIDAEPYCLRLIDSITSGRLVVGIEPNYLISRRVQGEWKP
ncbi:Uncharacterized protein HZ326_10281 [Fusarium oxysporum f. sp. albedinis]|nr:Uncharacterized protein HZ326_10281 [Fusarium oxysporum f. sp. albedinis]